MYVKIRLAKSFSRFLLFAYVQYVDVPKGGKKTKIRLVGGKGGVNGTLIDQYIKVRGHWEFKRTNYLVCYSK